jgi:hypothetical protein
MNDDNHIQNIIETMRRRDESMLPDRGNVMRAKRAAWRAFIALNGWHVCTGYFCSEISAAERKRRVLSGRPMTRATMTK